jgi:hypothetical protein
MNSLLQSLEQELAALAAAAPASARGADAPARRAQHPKRSKHEDVLLIDVDASAPVGAPPCGAATPPGAVGMLGHAESVRGSIEVHAGSSPSPAFSLPGLGHLACLGSSLQQGGSARHRRAWSADEQREAMQRHQVDVLAAQLFQQPGLEEHGGACSSPAACSSSSSSSSSSTLASLPASPVSPAAPAAEAQEGAAAGAGAGLGARRGHRRVRSMHNVLDILTQEQLMLGQQGEPRHLLLLPAAGGERSPMAAAGRLPPLRRPSALLGWQPGAAQAPGAAGELCS